MRVIATVTMLLLVFASSVAAQETRPFGLGEKTPWLAQAGAV